MSDIDTIAAIATAPGEGGVAIIRVSGPRALEIADVVFACPNPPPSQRKGGTFVLGRVLETSGEMIDEALLLIMRSPRSYTREDTIEIQCHGGPVVSRRILQRVLRAGARPAEPGEFTKRAFLNGRLDLTQAEAVADLIRARSDRAAAAAAEQLKGSLSTRINAIYDALVEVAANVEATLDFSDQEIPPDVLQPALHRLRSTIAEMRSLLDTWNEGYLLREGATVVIAGQPNVGKSTMLNALLGRERAIVSHIPGTTRDTIEETIIIDGFPIRLVDTAGIRETACIIEQEGIRRAAIELETADLCLYLVDARTGLDDTDNRAIEKIQPSKLIVVFNKIDLTESKLHNKRDDNIYASCYTSNISGYGISELKNMIVEKLSAGAPHPAHRATISTRHRLLIEEALTKAESAAVRIETGGVADDVSALHIRDAAEAIGKITGRIYHVDLLDSIFGRFCIGK